MASMTITTGIMGDTLGDLDGCDEQASYERYAELVEEALVERFPGATITVRLDTSIIGAQPYDMQTRVYDADGNEDEDTAQFVDQITTDVFESGDWVVKA